MKKSGRDGKGKFITGNKASLKHGGDRFLQTGKLPPGRRSSALRKELKSLKGSLESLCPERNIKDELLIASIIKLQGFTLLFEIFLRESGVFDPEGLKKRKLEFQGGFQVYLQMLSRQNKALDSLGISKQEKDEMLTAYEITQREEEEQASE